LVGIPKRLRPPGRHAGWSKRAVAGSTAPAESEFSFALKPRRIARHPGRFVIAQTEAKNLMGLQIFLKGKCASRNFQKFPDLPSCAVPRQW
jgi:hypothetical protein